MRKKNVIGTLILIRNNIVQNLKRKHDVTNVLVTAENKCTSVLNLVHLCTQFGSLVHHGAQYTKTLHLAYVTLLGSNTVHIADKWL